MLYCTLKQNCCCQSIYIRSNTMITMLVVSIIILIKCTTSEIHTTYRITYEWMNTSVYCLAVTKILREVKVLTCQHCFTSYIVRIHTFPTSRNCTSVEYYFKSIVIGIRQNSFIYLHHHLLVTTEEIKTSFSKLVA